MSLGVLWGEWIAQPPEHRALYLAVTDYRRLMDAADAHEAEMDREREERRGARR